MSENPTSNLGDDLRELRRSRDDRVVAGVLGGVARRLNVDPLLLRIVTAVLALFGGVGVVLYALGWLLIPDEDAETSVAEQALGRGRNGSPELPTVALAAFLVLAVLIAAGGTFRSGIGALLLVLAVIGAARLLRRQDEAGAAESAPPDAGYPGYPGYSAYPPADDGSTAGPPGGVEPAAGSPGDFEPADIAPAAAPASTESLPVEPVPAEVGAVSGQAGTGWPEGPDWGPPEPYHEPVPVEPARQRPRSNLGPITVSAVAVAMGILAVNDATWASIPVSAYLATALAIVGLGLLVGTWFGRSRGLIWLGLVLAIALPPAVLVGDGLDFTADQTTVHWTSVAEVADEPLRHGTGQVTYDLSELQLADDDEVELVISQSIGQLRVLVPPEADVQLRASATVGEIIAFDGFSGGFRPSRSAVNLGPDGAGGGSIMLDLEIDIGQIEVTR